MPVTIQSRDIDVLLAVDTYGCLTRRQIGNLLSVPERIMRRRAKLLARDGYLKRYTPTVSEDASGPPTPVYYPSNQGCQTLCERFGDDRFLLTRTSLPQMNHVAHAVAVSQTQILLRKAIEQQTEVELIDWLNENEIVNKVEPDPSKRRTTCMHFDRTGPSGKILCKPDSVFALRFGELTCMYLLEEDRATTTGTEKVLKRKMPGYQNLYQTQRHVTHFAEAFPGALPIFRVLFVTPTPGRRDALRREMQRQMRGKPEGFADVWRFVSKRDDLTSDNFLHGRVFYRCQGPAEGEPLVNLKRVASATEAPEVLNEVAVA